MSGMSAHDVLTTTRAVRRRLDFERAVPLHLVEEAIEIAVQAPTSPPNRRSRTYSGFHSNG